MEPHADFFRRFFSGRTLTARSLVEAAPVWGFTLQRKPSAGGSYPAYTPYSSNRGWHREWFYIWNPMEAPFPSFTSRRPERQDS